MKDERINVNIESIHIENLIITNETLGLIKDLNIKSLKNKEEEKGSVKKELDFSEKKDHNIDKDDNEEEIPYIPPRRIKAKRNFDN